MKQHSTRQQPQARLTGQILTMADSNIQPQRSRAHYFSLARLFAGASGA
jgi:hypothetical protein